MNEHNYWVYILSNFRRSVFYVGMTSNLSRRVEQHAAKAVAGFSEKYNCDQLLYAERLGDVRDALEREKQVKKYSREKKMSLIRSMNPEFLDITNLLD